MAEDKGKIITVRVSEDLHRAGKRKLVEGGTFQAVLTDLLSEWAYGTRRNQPAHVPLAPPSERHREEVELLRFVLEHGSKEEAGWIRGNLKMFAEAIRSRGAAPAARRKSGN